MRILVVCTANICRSPMAERLLLREARLAGVDVEVSSAGVRALEGRAADRGAQAELARRGIALSGHVARRADRELVGSADVVVTMEAAHVVDLVAGSGARNDTTFTLVELVELTRDRHRSADEELPDWLRRVAAGRRPAELLGRTDLDVEDPFGGTRRDYRRCADRLEALTAELASAMWGPARRDGAGERRDGAGEERRK